MKLNDPARIASFAVCVAFLLAAEGCSVLKPVSTTATSYYSLDQVNQSSPALVSRFKPRPTLIINPPSAAAGFGSSRIIYLRQPHKIEYFAHSEWVESPARMLAPLLVASLQASGVFRAVVLTPSAVAADWRLNTEIIRLQHEFMGPTSRVRFTLRAHFIDEKTRLIIAIREFDISSDAASADPYGGVATANLIVAAALRDLSLFSAEVAAQPVVPN
jgi:cholesterol transport system auxiliary component